MGFQIGRWNRQREVGILGSQTTAVLLLVLLGTNKAKTKRGWSPTEVAGQPAGGRGKARPQVFSSKCTAFNATKVSLPKVSFPTGPAKTHSPIQFSRFHVAEAVRFRAGQQQDVSLFETKHTITQRDPDPPGKTEHQVRCEGKEWDSRACPLTGMKSFFFRRMTSPTWISFHLAILNLNIKKKNDSLVAF